MAGIQELGGSFRILGRLTCNSAWRICGKGSATSASASSGTTKSRPAAPYRR